MMLAVRMAMAASAAASFTVLAHGVHDGTAAPEWTFDGWVVGPLLASLAWYAVGYLRLRHRTTAATAHHASASLFIAGWLVLAAALVTPLHEAGERSFAAHMVEHELLMLVAAPLLVLSHPIGIALWAYPQGGRRALAAFGRGISTPWHMLTAPMTATMLQAVALWAWHAPRLFDLALANQGWHVVQHLSFLVTALLFWWAVLRGHEHRVGVSVGCLFFTATVSGALGALMAFSSSPWYAGYAISGLDAFGLTPAEDQQLAGLLMWIPGGVVHALAGLALFARRLGREGGRFDAFDNACHRGGLRGTLPKGAAHDRFR
ncbi:cytochrome c oxidase assembly protein [Dyella sp. KRB-257]|uniref:cytochrome c oxidase assembly protein n=1 Tax=Dyella sp. KRB-257 TaxID=3400915 RepID=UPI003BFB4817